jgi:hypothetical protein
MESGVPGIVSEDPIMKMNSEFGFPWPLRVRAPTIWSVDE